MWRDTDFDHMRHALSLAERGLYTTTPNPRVGCVIVKDHQVIGEGWHRKAGENHAEVAALADARARGFDPGNATMYVTLAPCSHQGRVPPCTDAIIAAKIAHVIAACADPNPLAAHGGKILADAGIRFETGLLEKEAQEINRGFISRMQRKRPWLRSKIAASFDGGTALADGRSQWITGNAACHDGHHYRACACAVLTGIGTVRTDNPSLNVRAVDTARQPLRLVLDTQAQIPPTSKLLQDGGDTMIVTAKPRPETWPQHVRHLHLPAHGMGGHYNANDLHMLMLMLADMELNEIHVEAGAALNGAFLEADLIDEILCYFSPRILGNRSLRMFQLNHPMETLDAFWRFSFFQMKQLDDDLRIELRRRPHHQ